MSIIQAVVLGLVQGATEFLPISSSGHLVLVPFFFGWDRAGVGFDVALHLGTLAAVVWIFREDLFTVARAPFTKGPEGAWGRRLLLLLVVGTIPAALAGLLFQSFFERTFERPFVVSLELGATGLVLLACDRRLRSEAPTRDEQSITPGDALLVGAAQAVSILPGISRSGATIAAGLFRGIDRTSATRYSFLLSIPAIAGAALVKLPDITQGAGAGAGATTAGVIASAVSGAVAIRGFLRFITRRGLRAFAYYAFAVMALGLVVAVLRG